MPLPLSHLPVLAIDCQATAPNPVVGHLLELAWAIAPAHQFDPAMPVQARLCRLPPGTVIPPQVARITGLSADALAEAAAPSEAWQALRRDADQIAHRIGRPFCPAIIHYSRYEMPFLRHLNDQLTSPQPFALQIICTHRLAQRLLPALPRKGLRAVAGFLGHTVPARRRGASHVRATLWIWRRFVELLAEEAGIQSWEDLLDWLATPQRRSAEGRCLPLPIELRRGLPHGPGTYQFLRRDRSILYVGKAKNLFRRVNSYFQQKRGMGEHILEMLCQARQVRYRRTTSALEAALFENDLIKNLQPPYNLALQAEGRRVLFFSRDLQRSRPAASRDFALGPIVSTTGVQAMGLLLQVLSDAKQAFSRSAYEGLFDQLLFAEERRPPADILQSGWQLFLAHHRQRLAAKERLAPLLRLGRRLWQQWQRKKAATAACDDQPCETEAPNSDPSALPDWTPERVLAMLESIIRQGTHQLRRARWFSFLAEASLTWQAPGISVCRLRGLIISHACPLYHLRQPFASQAQRCPPEPPGWRRSLRQRQNSIDLVAYDRLRVLTTEIRRLIIEDAQPVVRFSAKAVLPTEKLGRFLWWI